MDMQNKRMRLGDPDGTQRQGGDSSDNAAEEIEHLKAPDPYCPGPLQPASRQRGSTQQESQGARRGTSRVTPEEEMDMQNKRMRLGDPDVTQRQGGDSSDNAAEEIEQIKAPDPYCPGPPQPASRQRGSTQQESQGARRGTSRVTPEADYSQEEARRQSKRARGILPSNLPLVFDAYFGVTREPPTAAGPGQWLAKAKLLSAENRPTHMVWL
ncbi:hypothetical protein HaLaN_25390, partial [Haematococcus lacustris]